MEFVRLGEEKPEDPEDEDPLQNQVIRRSLRKRFRPSSVSANKVSASK